MSCFIATIKVKLYYLKHNSKDNKNCRIKHTMRTIVILSLLSTLNEGALIYIF